MDKLRVLDPSAVHEPFHQRGLLRRYRGFIVGNRGFNRASLHLRFIAVNILRRQPFGFIGQESVQFPHFSDLCLYVPLRQMLLSAATCPQKIFAVRFQRA